MPTYGVFRCRITGMRGTRKVYYLAELLNKGGVRKVEIEMNAYNHGWKVGDEKVFYGKATVKGKAGRYIITPISKREAVEVFSKIFNSYDDMLFADPSLCMDEKFVEEYRKYAKIIGKEKIAEKRLEETKEELSE